MSIVTRGLGARDGLLATMGLGITNFFSIIGGGGLFVGRDQLIGGLFD